MSDEGASVIWVFHFATGRNCCRCARRTVVHLKRAAVEPEVSCHRDPGPHEVFIDRLCFKAENHHGANHDT